MTKPWATCGTCRHFDEQLCWGNPAQLIGFDPEDGDKIQGHPEAYDEDIACHLYVQRKEEVPKEIIPKCPCGHSGSPDHPDGLCYAGESLQRVKELVGY